MWQRLLELAALYPNLVATIFGSAAAAVSAVLGFLLKRPLQKQAERNLMFRAQLDGYESLVKSMTARIVYLEGQQSIYLEYESVLIRRLRDCEERHLAGLGPPP